VREAMRAQCEPSHGSLARGTPMPKARVTKAVVWECADCEKQCIPVRSESRCLW
jgi:hypothetical protein